MSIAQEMAARHRELRLKFFPPAPVARAPVRTPDRDPEGRRPRQHPVTFAEKIEWIFAEVAREFGITVEDIQGRSQKWRELRPRQVAHLLIYEQTNRSLPALGRKLGYDHSTIFNSVKIVRGLCARDPEFAARVAALRERIAKEMQ